MNSDPVYTINSPNTVHEIIDGEAIIINMTKGNYYSTDQTGAYIWDLISQQLSTQAMLARLMQRYSGDPQEIHQILMDFLNRLQSEDLVTTLPPEQAALVGTTQEILNDEVIPFIKPELHKYTDLQDLLLLDPIHEVDDRGWPGTESASDSALTS